MGMPHTNPPWNAKMNRRKGFTLIELLVVISIIALIMGILLPVLGNARNAAKSMVCLANIRTHGLAFTLYANDYNDQLPDQSEGVPGQFNMEGGGTSTDPRVGGGRLWYELLVEHGAGYEGYDAAISQHNDPREGVWLCPVVESTVNQSVHASASGEASWGGGYGVASNVIGYGSGSSAWSDGSPRLFEVDSPTTLMLVGDTGRPRYGFSNPNPQPFDYVSWMRAGNPPYSWRVQRSDQVAARHQSETANIAFFDGHAGPVKYEQIQANDGDLFGLDDPNVTNRR